MLIRYDAIKVVDIMNRIKVLRLERNIKQVDLAKAVSVSQAALSGYETGKYEPDFDTLKRIAEYFDVSIDYLLGGKLDSRDNVSATEDDIKETNRKRREREKLERETMTKVSQKLAGKKSDGEEEKSKNGLRSGKYKKKKKR